MKLFASFQPITQDGHEMPKRVETSVVGMAYRVTPATMKELQKEVPLSAKLVREPDNEYDENAVKVVLTDKRHKNFHIGFLPRQVAKEFAPSMDDGSFPFSVVWLISVKSKDGTGKLLLAKRKMPGNKRISKKT